MPEFEKNTLGVVSVNVMDISEFLMRFSGSAITIWYSSSPAFYSIDRLASFKFTKGPDMLVLFGSNNDVKASIPTSDGFGIKLKDSKDHYWVDKFNRKQALVIRYNSEQKEGDSDA